MRTYLEEPFDEKDAELLSFSARAETLARLAQTNGDIERKGYIKTREDLIANYPTLRTAIILALDSILSEKNKKPR